LGQNYGINFKAAYGIYMLISDEEHHLDFY